MHFDHERTPERVLHARGAAAHGEFELYGSMIKVTKAGFLNDTSVKIPVFVRFSTVTGSRGSADTARDVLAFSTRFYTQEGNFDLVGNNVPVFFVQDAIKFHWKPCAGVHSLVWDEDVKLAGKDADFHRRNLWESIDNAQYPAWELGVQIVPEQDERKFGFDLFDATKLIPESLNPWCLCKSSAK